MEFKNPVTCYCSCPVCGKATSVATEEEDYDRWQSGELIQNAMPYLSASEREVFISGLCFDCQKRIFGE